MSLYNSPDDRLCSLLSHGVKTTWLRAGGNGGNGNTQHLPLLLRRPRRRHSHAEFSHRSSERARYVASLCPSVRPSSFEWIFRTNFPRRRQYFSAFSSPLPLSLGEQFCQTPCRPLAPMSKVGVSPPFPALCRFFEANLSVR